MAEDKVYGRSKKKTQSTYPSKGTETPAAASPGIHHLPLTRLYTSDAQESVYTAIPMRPFPTRTPTLWLSRAKDLQVEDVWAALLAPSPRFMWTRHDIVPGTASFDGQQVNILEVDFAGLDACLKPPWLEEDDAEGVGYEFASHINRLNQRAS